jgi:hypothetical protein
VRFTQESVEKEKFEGKMLSEAKWDLIKREKPNVLHVQLLSGAVKRNAIAFNWPTAHASI